MAAPWLGQRRAVVLAAVVLAAVLAWVAPIRARAATSTATPGYVMATASGGVLAFGGSEVHGSVGGAPLQAPIVGLAGTNDGGGYWLVASDGGIFAYGDAGFFGSTGAMRLNKPIVGMAGTATGAGYWLVAADGGIFSFGDARFFGSTGAMRLNQPIVGMAATPSGGGYWLVARDGGIFSFGDARFFGSTGAMRLNQPIVGMAATPSGGGYWLVARDGGIFSFGDARFFGSTGALRLNQPIVGMAATPTAKGYWLVAADGGIFSFGDASFRGSAGANPLPKPVIGLITAPGGAAGISEQSGGLNPYPSGSLGYDVSWPQCGGNLPARTDGPAIVGVNGGRSFTANPCFATQAAWAGDALNVYVNTNAPNGTTASRGDIGPAGACAATDTWCRSYNYGFNAAQWSVASAAGAGAHPQVWWLDVETGNVWSSDQIANAKVVSGFIDGLHAYGLTVGIYSTSYQWGVIAGGYRPGLPGWVATGGTSNPAAYCSPLYAFTGGPTWLVQYGSPNGVDLDYTC